jgi:hypothetical protein
MGPTRRRLVGRRVRAIGKAQQMQSEDEAEGAPVPERIVAEDTAEATWLRLKRLTSAVLCRRVLGKRGRSLDQNVVARKAEQTAWAVRSALGYWEAKDAALSPVHSASAVRHRWRLTRQSAGKMPLFTNLAAKSSSLQSARPADCNQKAHYSSLPRSSGTSGRACKLALTMEMSFQDRD